MMKAIVVTHKALTGFISLGVIGQMLLAGLWHASVFSTPDAHVLFGLMLLLAAMLALIVALIGRMGRGVIVPTALLFGLIFLQPILMATRGTELAFISALHPVNAAFIGMTAGIVAARSKPAAASERIGAGQTAPAYSGD